MTWTGRECAEGIPVPRNITPPKLSRALGLPQKIRKVKPSQIPGFPFLSNTSTEISPPSLGQQGFFGKTVPHTSQKHSLSGSWVWTEKPELKRWQRERKEPWHSPKSQGARARQSEAGKAPLSPRAVFNSLSGCLGSLFLPTWN